MGTKNQYEMVCIETTDKLKRSALTHAIVNGNTNVASYLLYLGADPNRRDSSGNSLVHYAAAYGWYHCLKLLIKDAGASYNVDNDWKVSGIYSTDLLLCLSLYLELCWLEAGWK